jgi:tetratricopeptide (TPR) repeat protein
VSLLNAGQAELAVELALAQWEALVGTPESQAALLSLSRALANGYRFLGRHVEANAYLEHRIVLADQLGDYEALTYAYLSLEARYSFLGAVETSLALTEMAHTVARTHDLPAPQSLVLQHLVVLYRPRDLAAAITFSDEAVSAARRAGQRQSLDFSLANRTFVLWTAGQLSEMRDLAVEMHETVAHAVEMAQTAALLISWVTDEPLPLMESQPQILAEDVTWAAAAGVVEALAAGDGAAGVAIAAQAWDVVLETYGLEDDFTQIWPLFLDAALLAGDVAFTEHLLEPVLTAPRRSLSPLVVGLLSHFEGRLGALRGDEPAVVETALRDGVQRLSEFGARLHAARATEHLGLWLASRGREDEADEQFDSAASAYAALGARGWLRSLEESRALVSTSGA